MATVKSRIDSLERASSTREVDVVGILIAARNRVAAGLPHPPTKMPTGHDPLSVLLREAQKRVGLYPHA